MPSKGDFHIMHVPPCLIMPLWNRISFHIRRGAEVGGLTLLDTLHRLFEGTDGLWLITEGATVHGTFATTLCDEDGRRFVAVSNLSGRHARKWARKMCDLMADYAKDQGAEFVRCYGRRAWARLLPSVSIVGEHANGHAIFERPVQ